MGVGVWGVVCCMGFWVWCGCCYLYGVVLVVFWWLVGVGLCFVWYGCGVCVCGCVGVVGGGFGLVVVCFGFVGFVFVVVEFGLCLLWLFGIGRWLLLGGCLVLGGFCCLILLFFECWMSELLCIGFCGYCVVGCV